LIVPYDIFDRRIGFPQGAGDGKKRFQLCNRIFLIADRVVTGITHDLGLRDFSRALPDPSTVLTAEIPIIFELDADGVWIKRHCMDCRIAERNELTDVAIARNDDQKQPDAKDVLKKAFAAAKRPAVVEVYPADHGWCVPGSQAYDQASAERAWAELLRLYRTNLA